MKQLFRGTVTSAVKRRFQSAVCTNPGTYPVNEDSARETWLLGHELFVVADGLGGHAHGEVASALAVDAVVERFRQRPSIDAADLEDLVLYAHGVLRDTQSAETARGPRTTLALLASDGAAARWAHVGDSRLYFFEGARLVARTRDHSVPEMLHQAGEVREDQIRHHPDRARLLQALGQDGCPRVAVSDAVPLTASQAFLLCTDGWWENVRDSQMEATRQRALGPEDWLAQMSAVITDSVRHPQDNYSAVAAFVD